MQDQLTMYTVITGWNIHVVYTPETGRKLTVNIGIQKLKQKSKLYLIIIWAAFRLATRLPLLQSPFATGIQSLIKIYFKFYFLNSIISSFNFLKRFLEKRFTTDSMHFEELCNALEVDFQSYLFSNISMTTFTIHKYCLICTCNVSG